MFELDSEWHPSIMEINAETPIFHALTAGLSIGLSTGFPVDVPIGVPIDVTDTVSPYPLLLDLDPIVAEPFDSGPDELTKFHRDPLLAPIPIQVYIEQTFPAAHRAPTMIAAPSTPPTAPLPPTAGSSHGSALSMMTSLAEHTVLDLDSEYGRHHRPVPALPCAYRW